MKFFIDNIFPTLVACVAIYFVALVLQLTFKPHQPSSTEGCRYTITAYLPDDGVKRYYTNDYVANSEGVSFYDSYHGQILLHHIPVMIQSREKDTDYHKRPKDFRADEVDWLDGQDKLNSDK